MRVTLGHAVGLVAAIILAIWFVMKGNDHGSIESGNSQSSAWPHDAAVSERRFEQSDNAEAVQRSAKDDRLVPIIRVIAKAWMAEAASDYKAAYGLYNEARQLLMEADFAIDTPGLSELKTMLVDGMNRNIVKIDIHDMP